MRPREALRPLARAAATLAVVAAAGGGGRARSDDLAARASVGWDELRAPGSRAGSVAQRYELAYLHEISPSFLSYRLSLLATSQHGFLDATTFDDRTRSQELQPRLTLTSRSGVHSAALSYDLSLSRSSTSTSPTRRGLLQRFYVTGDLTPDPDWPRLAYFGSHQRARNLDDGNESRASVLDGTLAQTVGPVGWNAGMGWRNSGSGGSAATTNVYTPRAGATYQAALGRRGSLSTSYALTYLRTEISSSGNPVSQTVFVGAARALFGQNPLPADDTGVLFSALPALLDGNLEVPTAIALGLDGASFQNLALDIGRFLTVDQIDVVVRNAAGFLVPFGGPVSWAAYSSVDGLLWEPIFASSSTFDPVLSRYVVQFAPVTARYFKVVSFGLNDTPTYVSEVQAFEHRSVVGRRTLVDGSMSHVASGRAAVKVAEKVGASADANVSYAVVGLHGGSDRAEQASWQGGAGMQLGPFGIATYSVSHSRTGVLLAAGPRAQSGTTAAGASFAFLPALEAHAGASFATQSGAGVSSTSTAVSAGASARPSAFANLALDGSVGRQEVKPSDVRSTYWNASGTAALVATRSLQLQLRATVQQGRIRIPSLSGLLSQSTNFQQYSGTASWAPSTCFQAGASLIYEDTGERSGLIQAYRVYWYPLPGGAVSLNLTYDQGFDTITGNRSSRLTSMVHWQVNGHTTLDGTYSVLGNQDLRFGEIQQIAVAFGISL